MTRRTRRSANRSDRAEERIAALSRDPAADPVDPDHHLWRNGRLWWIAFTVHRGHLQERVRFSLGTDDVRAARARRDEVFALYERAADCRISLRFAPRGRRGARAGGPARAAS